MALHDPSTNELQEDGPACSELASLNLDLSGLPY